MSATTRPVAQQVTVCDLCDEIIPEVEPAERGSLTWGYIAHPVTNQTKRVWLIWPRRKRTAPPVQEKHYDFHADCVGRLITDAVEQRSTSSKGQP